MVSSGVTTSPPAPLLSKARGGWWVVEWYGCIVVGVTPLGVALL